MTRDTDAGTVRADLHLVQAGLARSRTEARELIAAGKVTVRDNSGATLRVKPSTRLPADTRAKGLQIDVDSTQPRYASRGALKLNHAVQVFGLPVASSVCLDAGQSTGGFTDCLLRHGARWVVGVDVGHGQLAAELRINPAVVCIEGVNLRDVTRGALADHIGQHPAPGSDADTARQLAEHCKHGGFDLVVADLSFISVRKVLPALNKLLGDAGQICVLVKPQFELGRGAVNGRGIVRNPRAGEQLRVQISEAAAALSLELAGWTDSPITGGDGNQEYLAHLLPRKKNSP